MFHADQHPGVRRLSDGPPALREGMLMIRSGAARNQSPPGACRRLSASSGVT